MEKPRPPKETAKPFFLKKGHRRFHSCTRRQQQCQGPPGGGHGSLSWQSVRQLKSSWAAGLDAIQLPPHPHPPSPAAEPCPSPAAPGPAYLLPLPSGPPPPPPSMPLPGPPLLSQTHCLYLQPGNLASTCGPIKRPRTRPSAPARPEARPAGPAQGCPWCPPPAAHPGGPRPERKSGVGAHSEPTRAHRLAPVPAASLRRPEGGDVFSPEAQPGAERTCESQTLQKAPSQRKALLPNGPQT